MSRTTSQRDEDSHKGAESTLYLPGEEEKNAGLKQNEDRKEPTIVVWEENDPENPLNWSAGRKIWITFMLGMLAMAGTLGSSIMSPANETIARYLGVSDEVIVLSNSLFVLGSAFGPMCWAPLSEIWGRKVSILPAMFGLSILSIGNATSKNAAAFFITRFIAGVFASAPISNVAAALGDIYLPKVRGAAMSFYAIAVVGGPTLGPTIGAAIYTNPHLGWRWTAYIQAIWTFAITLISVFALPEIYHPVLLKRKAIRLRKETGNTALYHPHENIEISPRAMITKHFSRPLMMLVTEPMVTCIAFYASFVYSVLYLTLPVFPLVFAKMRHWAPVTSTLPFVAMFVGVLVAVPVNISNQPPYARLVAANNGKPVPEGRLLPMAIGGFVFAIGLFWFGWTAVPISIHWASPMLGVAFIGGGFIIIFQQCLNFLVDTYGMYAASATASNTFLRSVMAAGLPMAAGPMYRKLGVGPATSLIGGVAALALPVPFLFMKYGARLRAKSKFTPAGGIK